MMACTNLHISDLPDCLLIKILSYLEQVELHLSVSWVCKKWNTVCYDRDLWRDFIQLKYERSYNGGMDKIEYQISQKQYAEKILVDTIGFQFYILQRVHQHIKHISLSPGGITYLPLLNIIGLQSLESMILPYPYYTDYSENGDSVQNIEKSTTAKIYAWNRHLEPGSPLCHKKSKVLMLDDKVTLTTDWTEIKTWLLENADGNVVSLHCGYETETTEKIIPAQIFKQLAMMKNLQHLQLSRCSLQNLKEVQEDELDHLCINLKSLKVFSDNTTTECISRLLSHSHSLKHLHLGSVHFPSLSVIPHSCKGLITELHIDEYKANPASSTCHLCEIAFHCTKLRRLSLGIGNIFLKLNTFLHLLATKCKNLEYLSLPKCEDVDTDTNFTYRNGLTELLVGCQKLKVLRVSAPNAWGGFPTLDFNPPQTYHEQLPIEELLFCYVGSRFWKPPSETVGKMCNLQKLRLSMVRGDFVSIEFMKTLSATCNRLTHLTIHEPCNHVFVLEKGHSRIDHRGPVILDHIQLKRLEQLYLCLECYYYPIDQILKLIQRSEYLERAQLTPVDRKTIGNIRTELDERPHRCTACGLELEVRMLSAIRWKQLTAPEWKDTWRSIVKTVTEKL